MLSQTFSIVKLQQNKFCTRIAKQDKTFDPTKPEWFVNVIRENFNEKKIQQFKIISTNIRVLAVKSKSTIKLTLTNHNLIFCQKLNNFSQKKGKSSNTSNTSVAVI